MSEAAEFRADTRAWLKENCPTGARGPGNVPWGSRKIDLPRDSREWLDNMASKGWTVPTWPKASEVSQQVILQQNHIACRTVCVILVYTIKAQQKYETHPAACAQLSSIRPMPLPQLQGG